MHSLLRHNLIKVKVWVLIVINFKMVIGLPIIKPYVNS